MCSFVCEFTLLCLAPKSRHTWVVDTAISSTLPHITRSRKFRRGALNRGISRWTNSKRTLFSSNLELPTLKPLHKNSRDRGEISSLKPTCYKNREWKIRSTVFRPNNTLSRFSRRKTRFVHIVVQRRFKQQPQDVIASK